MLIKKRCKVNKLENELFLNIFFKAQGLFRFKSEDVPGGVLQFSTHQLYQNVSFFQDSGVAYLIPCQTSMMDLFEKVTARDLSLFSQSAPSLMFYKVINVLLCIRNYLANIYSQNGINSFMMEVPII